MQSNLDFIKAGNKLITFKFEANMKKTKDPSNGATNGNKEPLIGKEEDYKAEQVIEEENKQGALFKRNPYENSWLLQQDINLALVNEGTTNWFINNFKI